jgi:hypothetical protein
MRHERRPDTPGERFAEYQSLFRRALERRERRDASVVIVFRADAGAHVADLARREAACCPFLDYRVDAVGDEVVLTVTNPWPGREGANATLDAFYALPDHSDLEGLLARIT